MSAFFNTNESTNKQKYDNSFFENEKNSLRRQFIQIIPSNLIQEQKQVNYSLSALKSSKQYEEFSKIQSEISCMEEKIHDLEISRKKKLSKIDDLRLLIRRVANEECFSQSHSNQSSNGHHSSKNNFSNTERCDKKSNQTVFKSQISSQSIPSSSTTSRLEPQGQEDPQGEVPAGICGNKDGSDTSDGQNDYSLPSSSSIKNDDLSQVLCFWQEFLPATTKFTTDFMH